MQQCRKSSDEITKMLQRMKWCSDVEVELASCPIEELTFVNGQITFFVDARRCGAPPLPRFGTAAQAVNDMSTSERHDFARYLVRVHRARFASAARGVGAKWPEIVVAGDEIEFNLSPGFICEALKIYEKQNDAA